MASTMAARGYHRREGAPRGAGVRTGFKNVVRPRRREDDLVHEDLGRALAHAGSVLCLTSAARHHGFGNQEAPLTFLAVPAARVYGQAEARGIRLIATDLDALRALGGVADYPLGRDGTPVAMTTPAFTLAHLLARSSYAGARQCIGRDEMIDSLKLYVLRHSLADALRAGRAMGVKQAALNLFEGAMAMGSAA